MGETAASEVPMQEAGAENASSRAAAQNRPDDGSEPWVANAALLWENRRFLAKVSAIAFVLSIVIAITTPNQYDSSTRIMPPEQTTGGAAMLAALSARSGAVPSGLSSLAGGLLGGRSNGALFLDLLHSGTVGGHLIERFHLEQVYHKRYMDETLKALAGKTDIAEDPKSGVITITVKDRDRVRARDMAQAYLDELNALVVQVDTSAARREREFIEQRLKDVNRDLQQAQAEMSEFSTKNTAIDIKEQTRAMVDAGARLQGQLVASESELDSLQQIYGAENVRVRAAEARVNALKRELNRESNGSVTGADDNGLPYPALRELPALAVPWENLYRRVRIEETVYEMLSSQYETARIEEAKSLPTVRVIDPAGVAERKSRPHRKIIVLAATAIGFVLGSLFLLMRRWWRGLAEGGAKRRLGREMAQSLWGRAARFRGGAR
jgi:capsule polysaccharide export protein KpsE/RkpR